MNRRAAIAGSLSSFLAASAGAFGQEGAFHPRLLSVHGTRERQSVRETGLSHWAWELVRRTSAPGRLHPKTVAADAPELLDEPFCVWAGSKEVSPLMGTEIRGLRAFLLLGGLLFVDDSDAQTGQFGRSARRELARVIPEVPIAPLPSKHVLYKSYYLVERPIGRDGISPDFLDAMVRGHRVQVLFSSHDLLGSLARRGDSWALPMAGGEKERQLAVRLAVNLAMYVLCSDYKDDQVHAEELMRRRGRVNAPR